MFVQEFTRWVFGQLEKQRHALERYHKKVPQLPKRFIETEIKNRIHGLVSLHELESTPKRELFALTQLDTYMTDSDRSHFAEPTQRRWQPTRKFSKHKRHQKPGRREPKWSRHRHND